MTTPTSAVALATTRSTMPTTRSDRRGAGGADERGEGETEVERARVHAHARCSKCTGFIRIEKIGCVSTAARLLSPMTRLAGLCDLQTGIFRSKRPSAKAWLVAHQPRRANTTNARAYATHNARFKCELTFVRLQGRGDLALSLLPPFGAVCASSLLLFRALPRSYLTSRDYLPHNCFSPPHLPPRN